jgi:Zn-dependent alcohol dehydrogenase
MKLRLSWIGVRSSCCWLRLDEMISSRIPLSEVNGALDRMRQGEAAK